MGSQKILGKILVGSLFRSLVKTIASSVRINKYSNSSTRSRNDSMTSNQSTLERRRIQTPRSTISQAGSELSLAESSATEHTTTKKVDLFGGAKPADIKDKFLEYEEKMRREREAHMKMKEEHEKKQRKDSYRERQITPETATVPGQIKILQKDRRTSQGEEVTGTIDSRRESQEPQWSQEKEISDEVKKVGSYKKSQDV